MELEWDDDKRDETLNTRGIDFGSMRYFDWETATDQRSDRHGEVRHIATGYIGDRLHRVVYTFRGANTRIISLRKANPREIRQYEQRR